MEKMKSEKFLRERKFMTVLPLLMVPFLTLIFWSMGGGKGKGKGVAVVEVNELNTRLPAASNKVERSLDKLAFYSRAEKDSLEHQRMASRDPYLEKAQDSGSIVDAQQEELGTVIMGGGNADPNEQKVYEKLKVLNESLKSAEEQPTVPKYSASSDGSEREVGSKDIDRLEEMLVSMDEGGGEDPELRQLSGMLDKILDIQHPDRVREGLRKTSSERKGEVFPVTAEAPERLISVLDSMGSEQSGGEGFFSLDNGTEREEGIKAIRAVVHETQTVTSGSIVKLRLTDDIYCNGRMIPKDHFVFGVAEVSGERLAISIESILYDNYLFPVNLAVYDMDGLNGVYIPGAITRDVAKESVDRSMQSLGLASLDPSIGAQAMSAGIETAKNLLKRKVKVIKVTVKAGYKVVLKDMNKREDA
ncbi:conjugative transposon protein TraM [Chitinophaga japonensis]|uniref:Conjugative transposon TraM protein n=1 Tax=Chitinophaga japonensis TaxID=104662 RepID=A0A562T2G8_CHIJA|nr:conjugative transposon protein TraM [Chitinophaga japonensis]TWI87847.1 conjugative transposon TraM protein [Chitinophaga japonensis]